MIRQCIVGAGAVMALAITSIAHAETLCGVQTHQRFGETRAYFQDVLASCRADGGCSVLSHVVDRRLPANFRQQLRIEFAQDPSTPPDLALVAVDPMADLQKPMTLRFGRAMSDLTGAMTNGDGSANVYVFQDKARAASTIETLFGGARSVVWTYRAEATDAKAVANFSLRGSVRARDWVQCMRNRG